MNYPIFVFNLTGKFAHWRKIYTNSSSLTYYFPPRTSIIGIIASVLEKERDSYYEEFSKKNLDVTISIENKELYTILTSVNYKMIKNLNDTYSVTQIPLEILVSRDGKISYYLYLRPKNEEIFSILNKLKDKINSKKLGFGVYLGQRQFRGDLDLIDVFEDYKEKETTYIDSIINANHISDEAKEYVIDFIPVDFNRDRILEETGEYASGLGKPLEINKTKAIVLRKINKRIIFM